MCQTGAKQQALKFGNSLIETLLLLNNTETEFWKQNEVFEGYKKSVKRYNNVTMRPSG
jgi:hypothetical protein